MKNLEIKFQIKINVDKSEVICLCSRVRTQRHSTQIWPQTPKLRKTIVFELTVLYQNKDLGL